MLVDHRLSVRAEIDLLGRAAKRPTEAQVQRAIIDRLRLMGALAVHVPNAGLRSERAGQRLKGEGMRPGFPDLVVIGQGRVCFLEVKAPGTGRLSVRQIECHEEIRRRGAQVFTVTSQDEAVAACRAAEVVA
jgi:hypothetical protein